LAKRQLQPLNNQIAGAGIDMQSMLGSLLVLLVPLLIAVVVAKYCWQQGWYARITLIACGGLVSLHTHAYYFPTEPLKVRYAASLLKTSPTD
jgi:hypothetical protein